MGEFASRGPTHAGASYSSAGTASSPAREASPADRARDAVAGATHKLTLVREAVAELTAAHGANDLPRWNHAQKALEAALVQANRRFEQTRTQLTGATPETTSTFEAATRELAASTERSHTAEPPKGYVQVALEAELLAALRGPSIAGFAGRRDSVRAELDQLSIADLRALRARIASPQPQDELAGEIWKLGPKLRQEVADFIHNIDRRKARERAAEARRKPTAIAPEPESLDAKLRRAFEGHDAETELLAVIAPLDLSARGALTTRLRTYRQGSGDDIAARFSRLERDAQSRLLAQLAQPPVLDAVHVPAPVMLADSAPVPTVVVPALVVAAPEFDDRSKCEIEAAKPHAQAPRSVPEWEARTFAVTHASQLVVAISDRVVDLGVPDPHPRLFWRGNGGRFVSQQLRSYLALAPALLVERVEQLTGQNIVPVATRVLEQRGGSDELALEVAIAFDRPVSDAVARIGARVRATMDASGAAADPSHVVVGSHLDRIVADAMQGNVAGAKLARNEKAELDGRNLSHGPRRVELEWLGRTRGADLWNWIVVKTPHDATAEDVASTPLANGKTIGLENAERIAASPPYFGIPAEFARLAKDAIDYAPPAVKAHPEAATVVDASALAHSTASDGAALAQAHAATRADVPVENALDRLDLELDAVQRLLTPWGADAPIAAALAFVARRKAELAKSPDNASHWKTILSEQERVVHEVADKLETFTSRAKPHTSAAHDQVVRAYAHAVEVSHLAAQARPALAKAAELVAMLPLTQLEHDLVARAGSSDDPDSALEIARRAANIRATLERGTANPGSMAEVLVDGDEHALHAQLTSLGQRLDEIDKGAHETGIPDGDFANGLPTLHALSSQMRKRIAHWNDSLAKASHFTGPTPGLSAKQTVVAQRRRALDQIGAELQAAYKDLEVDKYVAWAQCTIADRKRVAAIVKLVARLAAEIAIMIASMQLATAALAAVRGVITGIEIVNEARQASLVVRLATAVVGAGIDTTANGALLGGELTPKAYAENAVAMVTMTALMAPFNGLLKQSADIESGLRGLGKKAVRSAAELVLEGATGYAGSVAGHAAVNGFTIASPTSGDILEQGFTLLVGKFVHQRASAMTARIDVAASKLGADAVADLRGRLTKLERSSAKEQLGKDEALALLEQRQQLLVAERAAYKGHPELEATMAHEPALSAEFADVPLVLSKLEPVVRGHSYLGTPDAIEHGIEALKTSGLDPKTLPEEVPGRRRVQVGDRIIEIAERSGSANEREAAPRGGRDGQPASKANDLIRKVGSSKAFGEQHAHAPGSVPIDAVLGMVGEWPHITNEQRTEQIALLHDLIAEFTAGKQDRVVSDLTPASTNIREGVVRSIKKTTIASTFGTVELGLLNRMLDAKQLLLTSERSKQKDVLRDFDAALDEYRNTISMQKPDDARYDASIDTTQEFFVRYKMIAAHGLGTAEIAARRASAEQLGMQELRYGSEHSSVATLHAEADQLLRRAPLDADVSNTFATTKNRLATQDAAKNEQQLVVEFVKEWEVDPTLERAFNGFESAGVEDAKKPPALLWEAAAQRTFRNAMRARARLNEEFRTQADVHALAERLARLSGTVAVAEATLNRYRAANYEAAIVATEKRGRVLRATSTATMPGVDPRTQQLTEQFAGLSIEQTAADTRNIVEAMRAWSAETGVQHGDITLLGMTMHAGEQLLNTKVDPFTLLDQVDQAVSLGTDRIGHALILGIDPEVLVEKGRLPRERVEEFRIRQQEVVGHVRSRGVVIETNLSSNTEISNLTQGEHPAGKFAREGLRVTVNTDDETVLSTTIEREFERVNRARGVTRNDIATMMLEGYRSRMGNRELHQRARIRAVMVDALAADLTPSELEALATHLASYFHVSPAGSSRGTISRVVDTALGI